ncbi:hypothetical protein [Spirosoma pollinicola]|uniref:hypothetical protein n=1 Tax=Spirosoma pollinicola TaxID=2057025 RepID=UPI00197D5E5F|nr:hypothetical protein [Spirosoma pollinicola]
MREETLKRATVRLVNYQHKQWLAPYWGSINPIWPGYLLIKIRSASISNLVPFQ